MTEAEIVNSPVFKALNLLIDEAVEEIIWRSASLQRALEPSAYGMTIDTRVSYEEGGRDAGRRALPVDVQSVSDGIQNAQAVAELRERVRNLNTFKLRLLNDYDFTHGRLDTHKAVFGPDSTVE